MTRRSPFKPDELLIALQPLCAGEYGQHVVAKGAVVRGDHPAVQLAYEYFAPVAATPQEQQQRRNALAAAAEPPPEPIPTRIPKIAPDEEAFIAIRNAGRVGARAVSADGLPLAVTAGAKVAASHPAYRSDPDAFVPVVPKGLSREDALVALETMQMGGGADRTERIVWAGTWVHRDDEMVRLHPFMFVRPGEEDPRGRTTWG